LAHGGQSNATHKERGWLAAVGGGAENFRRKPLTARARIRAFFFAFCVCVKQFHCKIAAMKLRTNPKGTRSQSPNNRRQFVKNLAAEGFSGDVIAARLGVNKNYLRAEYALDLHAGRQIKAAKKAAAALTKQERERAKLIERIERSFQSHWYDAESGNLLYGGAHTVAEALAWIDGARAEFSE
jgi:hypothetical protein